jgi:hypothetical protein
MANNNNTVNTNNVEYLLNKLLEGQETIERKIDAIARHVGYDVNARNDIQSLDSMFQGAHFESHIPRFRQNQVCPISISASAYTDSEEVYSSEEARDTALVALKRELDLQFEDSFFMGRGKEKSFSWDDMKRLALYLFRRQHQVNKVPNKFKRYIDGIERNTRTIAVEILQGAFKANPALMSRPLKHVTGTVAALALAREERVSSFLPLRACKDQWASKHIISKCWPEAAIEYRSKKRMYICNEVFINTFLERLNVTATATATAPSVPVSTSASTATSTTTPATTPATTTMAPAPFTFSTFRLEDRLPAAFSCRSSPSGSHSVSHSVSPSPSGHHSVSPSPAQASTIEEEKNSDSELEDDFESGLNNFMSGLKSKFYLNILRCYCIKNNMYRKEYVFRINI